MLMNNKAIKKDKKVNNEKNETIVNKIEIKMEK